MNKTVLLLGGSAQQLDSFAAAKRLGYRTVLCDYDPNCPGRELADSFYEVSTLDAEAVLAVAREEHVDGVVSYASDAPAPIAAWVSERLRLPTNPYESVAMLCDKGLFRAFLCKNGFSVPRCAIVGAGDYDSLEMAVREVDFPLVMKPVDSAGSRGVTVVRDPANAPEAFSHALAHSRKREVVVEQYVETVTPGRVIEAEIFVEHGRIVSWGLMSAYRDLSLNGVVPSCCVHPADIAETVEDQARQVLSRLVERAGIVQGPMNVELIFDASGNMYIIDVGPRNGGNFLPSFFSHISGDDITAATLRIAVGEPSDLQMFERSNDGLWVQFMHYSHEEGVFRGFSTTPEYDCALIETHLYKEIGSQVDPLKSTSDSIGVSLLHFPGETDARTLTSRLPKMCHPVIEAR